MRRWPGLPFRPSECWLTTHRAPTQALWPIRAVPDMVLRLCLGRRLRPISTHRKLTTPHHFGQFPPKFLFRVCFRQRPSQTRSRPPADVPGQRQPFLAPKYPCRSGCHGQKYLESAVPGLAYQAVTTVYERPRANRLPSEISAPVNATKTFELQRPLYH
jgi:hypothetical protein